MKKYVLPPTPINSLGHGLVYRAFVSLPLYMQDDARRPLQERVVFFECGETQDKGIYLADLLNKVWQLPDNKANEWLEHGDIYNIYSTKELMEINISDDPEMRVLETGGGPDGIHYAKQCDVDIFVTPRVAQRLRELLERQHD